MDLTLDEDVEIMFTTHPGQIISRDKLVVKLSPSYNRKIMSDPMESEIEKNWQKRVEENPRMWNGTKFRIDDAYEENGKTIFHLGITCYKDFIGTNWSPRTKEIQQLGISKCGNSHAFMSDALGVGALVETADNYTILLKRSEHCGEAVGLYDIPGGHPEPKVKQSLHAEFYNIGHTYLNIQGSIQGYPKGVPIPKEEVANVLFPENCMKMKKKLMGGGGHASKIFLCRSTTV